MNFIQFFQKEDFWPFVLLPIIMITVVMLDNTSSKISFIALVISMVIFSIFYLSATVNNFNYTVAILVIFITLYAMTVFPGAPLLFHTSVIPVAFLFFVWFMKVIDFSVLETRIRNGYLFDILIAISVITLLMSIFIFNVKDLIIPMGISRVIAFIGGLFLFGNYIGKRINNDLLVRLNMIKGIVVLGFVTAIIGLVTVFVDVNPAPSIPNGAISFFRHVNLPTFLYVFTVPCILYLIYFEKRQISDIFKIFLYVALGLMITNVLLTFNRSGMISISIGILFITIIYSRKVFLILLVLFMPIVSYVLPFLVSKGAGTVLARIQLYFVSFEMMRSSFGGFLFGFGVESNFEIFEKFRDSAMVLDTHNYPHNSYIFFILQFGIIPFIFVLLTLIVLIFKGFRKAIMDKNVDKFTYLSLTIAVSVMAYGLFEDFFLFTDNFMYYLVLMFIGSLYYEVSKNDTHSSGN